MNPSRLVIELLPTRVDVVAYDGRRRVAGRRLPREAASDVATWIKDLRTLAPTLRGAVQELGASQARATVLYRSPRQAVDLADVQARWASEACDAARLSIADSLTYSELSAVCQAVSVGRDAQGNPRKHHVVVAAERDDVSRALVQLVEQADLRFAHAVPIDAAVDARLVQHCLEQSRADNAMRGVLHLGEYSAMFLVANEGDLVLHRRIGLGAELLATSLTRPLRIDDRPKPVTLTMDEARRILYHHGLPERDEIVHKDSALRGSNIIPVIQPTLQRLLVELRQSLRFGLSDSQRAGLNVTIIGPGSTIPNLSKLISDELNVTINQPQTDSPSRSETPGSDGSELDYAQADEALLNQINLQPAELAARSRAGSMRRLLMTGAAVALLVVAFDAVRLRAQVSNVQQHVDALAQKAATDDALRMTEGRLRESMAAMATLESAMLDTVGTGVDLRAILHELSIILPDSIRFTGMNFTRSSDGMTGRINGFAKHINNEQQRTELNDLIQAMRKSPLFSEVVLGDVHAGSLGNAIGEQFEVAVTGVPVSVALPGVASPDADDANDAAQFAHVEEAGQ